MTNTLRRPAPAGELDSGLASSTVLSTFCEVMREVHPDYGHDHQRSHMASVVEAMWDRGLVIVSSADYLRSRPAVGWMVAVIATVIGFVTGLVTAGHVG